MVRRALLLAVLMLAGVTAAAEAIVGGRPASRPYPFMASLQSGGQHFCGGSLVRSDWVLTAAHCVEGTSDDELAKLEAVIGRVDLSKRDGVAHAVDRIVIHEGYSGDPGGGNDIALLHLAAPSAQAPVRIAAAAERATWDAGARARVVGWGTSFFLVGPSPSGLREVDVPVVGDTQCANSYGEFDARSMLCAGERLGLKDSCQGDSGGPLLAGDLQGEPVQVGTVSYGLGCGFPLFYGVYGRVGDEALRSWLDRNLPAERAPAAPAAPAPAPAARSSKAKLSFRRDLGSARKLRRRRKITVRVRSTAPVRRVSATISRRGRVLGRARAAKAGRLVFRLRSSAFKRGKLRLSVRATDAAGRQVKRSATVRLHR